MKQSKIKNAIIESVIIDDGDRGLLTAWLMLSFGSTSQGFGGYSLYLPKSYQHFTEKGDFAGHFIFRCMQIADVNSWDKVKGKTIRVKYEANTNKIIAIGHIIKEDWFNPNEDFAKMSKK